MFDITQIDFYHVFSKGLHPPPFNCCCFYFLFTGGCSIRDAVVLSYPQLKLKLVPNWSLFSFSFKQSCPLLLDSSFLCFSLDCFHLIDYLFQVVSSIHISLDWSRFWESANLLRLFHPKIFRGEREYCLTFHRFLDSMDPLPELRFAIKEASNASGSLWPGETKPD